MDSKPLAIEHYALFSDRAALTAYRDCCEGTADQITKLVVLMERYNCEDGVNWTSELHRLCDLHEELLKNRNSWNWLENITKSEMPNGEVSQFNKQVHLVLSLKAEIDQCSKSLGPLDDAFHACNPCTRAYLVNSHQRLLDTLGTVTEKSGAQITATTWRQARRILWDLSAELYGPITWKEDPKWVGRPPDGKTEWLVRWAEEEDVSLVDVARMIVEADADPDDGKRPRTIPGRIRKETARLRTYVSNQKKKSSAKPPPVEI